MGADFGRAKDARGISVKVEPGAAKALVTALRAKLATGWVAYVGTSRDLSGEMPGGDPRAELTHEVAIGPGLDAGDIVRLAHVDPVNFGLDSEDVAARVIDWTDRYKIDVYMADTETLQAEIPTSADIAKLAVEVAA